MASARVGSFFWALLSKNLIKKKIKTKHHNVSCLHLNRSYPLLKLPLPGTGPVEYSTAVKDYSVPSPDAGLQQGDLSERPDWVSLALRGWGCVWSQWSDGISLLTYLHFTVSMENTSGDVLLFVTAQFRLYLFCISGALSEKWKNWRVKSSEMLFKSPFFKDNVIWGK